MYKRQGPLQLPPDTLSPQAAHIQKCIHCQQVIFIGTKSGGISLHIGGDEGLGFPDDCLISAALQILREELVEICVIPVSYTNLDVYKRQAPAQQSFGLAGIVEKNL